MSGIYIHGIAMPQEETETIIRIQPDGTVLDQYGHHLAVTAVPVPEHGRLIDGDALCERLEKAMKIKPYLGGAFNTAISFALTDPTIIPAEEGET